jgi:hypothetical protein
MKDTSCSVSVVQWDREKHKLVYRIIWKDCERHKLLYHVSQVGLWKTQIAVSL